MGLPDYTPVPAIPPNAYFRALYNDVYLPRYPINFDLEKLIVPESECDLSREIKVEVKKSRARQFWDAIWSKPKNWWSGLSKEGRCYWKYLFGFICCAMFVTLVGGITYVTYDSIPQHVSKDWAKYEYTSFDYEYRSKLKRKTPVLTGTTTVGLLATSTARPSSIAMPFTT